MSRPKDIGTRWESACRAYLRKALDDERIDRRALHGAHDMGDLMGIFAHGGEGIAECKAHREVTPGLVEAWRRQTTDERDNADADFGLLVVKVAHAPVGRARVHVTLRDLSRICLGMGRPADEDAADERWVSMTLSECCDLMRGD